jgi:hypothetical protein
MIGVGARGHTGKVVASISSPFGNAFLAVTNIIFAYAGHVAFIPYVDLETCFSPLPR